MMAYQAGRFTEAGGQVAFACTAAKSMGTACRSPGASLKGARGRAGLALGRQKPPIRGIWAGSRKINPATIERLKSCFQRGGKHTPVRRTRCAPRRDALGKRAQRRPGAAHGRSASAGWRKNRLT